VTLGAEIPLLTRNGRHHAGLAPQTMPFRRRSGSEGARGGIGVARIAKFCRIVKCFTAPNRGQADNAA
jgi:hypothetical protein